MSIAMLAGPLIKAGGARLATRGVGALARRLGRRGARAAIGEAVGSATGAAGRGALALTRRVVGGRAGLMVGVPRRRRRRGISGVELRGFKKVARLLASVGMAPRGLGRHRARRSVFSARRIGDPFDEGLD